MYFGLNLTDENLDIMQTQSNMKLLTPLDFIKSQFSKQLFFTKLHKVLFVNLDMNDEDSLL